MIDISKMPGTFGLCMAKDTECPLASQCMRSLVFWQTAEEGNRLFVGVVNPYNKSLHYATEQCTLYKKCQKVRFARGMERLFDNVKKGDYQNVRWAVMRSFSCESFFYRSQNGSRLITPEEQERIAKVFKEKKVEGEPQFDSYVEEYDWR